MSLFRYPGGKTKIKSAIIDKLKEITPPSVKYYREPFFGGGSIGLNFVPFYPSIKNPWFNDFDKALCLLWYAIFYRMDELKNKILEAEPSVELFFEIKKRLSSLTTIPDSGEAQLQVAIDKLLIHQMSYSGLGVKAGGPIGGTTQSSNYKIDCRWSPKNLVKKLDRVAQIFSENLPIVTDHDFSELIIDNRQRSVLYLDPPYYVKGGALYQHSFTKEDHVVLANMLRGTEHIWLLSYDDCPEIRELYSWAKIEEIPIKYTITSSINKESGVRFSNQTKELLISRR